MKKIKYFLLFVFTFCFIGASVYAIDNEYSSDVNEGYDSLKINVGITDNAYKNQSQNGLGGNEQNVEQKVDYQNIEVIGEGEHYTIGPGDILEIKVRNQKDFSGRFAVNDEGYIQYNWVGDVKASGFTKEELKSILKESLRKYIKYPEVSIIILEYKSKFVYVLGSVAKPGKYPMKGDLLTLRDAIVMAGLPDKTAAMKRTKIIRETENGPKSIKVNLKDLLFKGRLEYNYDLLPGDIVVVPKSRYHKTMDVASKVLSPLFQALAVYEIGFGKDDNGLLR